MPSRPDRSSVSRRHSWSLVLLCAVQACERFAFLAMLPMFVPYAQERQAPALQDGRARRGLGPAGGGHGQEQRLGRVGQLLHALVAHFGEPQFDGLGLGAGNGLHDAQQALGRSAVGQALLAIRSG